MRAGLAIVLGLLAPASVRTAAGEDWPQFLGPRRDGTALDDGLASAWRASGLRELWRARIGEGYSGVAVVGDRLYGMDSAGGAEFLFARGARDGAELWRVRTGSSPQDVYGGLGPRVTPSVDGNAVVTLTGEGALLAVAAADGRPIWRRELRAELGWRRPAEGVAGSPLVADGRIYTIVGGPDGRALAAFDRRDGRTLWAAQDDRTSYSSAVRWDHAGVAQVLFLAGSTLYSLDPASGRLLWRHPWPTYDFVNVATPIPVPPGRVFISSGYDQGAALVEVRRRPDGSLEAAELWRSRELRNHFNNSVHREGVFYGFDNAILKAVDAATGRALWRERGFGQGSLVLLGAQLVILSEDGELALADAGREALAVRSRRKVLEGRCWTPPAIARGRVYLRGPSELVALAPASAPAP
jgi:outer membrane protein assembly factor BamB